MIEPVLWHDDGSPSSARFKDVYRSRSGALAQAEAVFLHGIGLPEAWRHRPDFAVLETGFGLGLNFLATWAAWRADGQRSESLQFTSVEAYPVAAADIVRSAHAAVQDAGASHTWAGDIGAQAWELAAHWQDWSPGLHPIELDGGRVRLLLAMGLADAALNDIQGSVDAIYLDGFSPARNPEMWSDAVFQALARRCRPGTRLATYSAARRVREGLQRVGFAVRRCKGLPPKWHRLEAVFEPP